MLIGVPALMLLLYGYALNFDVRHVASRSRTATRARASRELIASFTNSTYFDLVATPAAGDGPRRGSPSAGWRGRCW